jgi:hypothetical protein
MTSIIKEIEDDELVQIGGSYYARVPAGALKRLGFMNADGTKETKKMKRAIIDGKNGEFMAVWGRYNNNPPEPNGANGAVEVKKE